MAYRFKGTTRFAGSINVEGGVQASNYRGIDDTKAFRFLNSEESQNYNGEPEYLFKYVSKLPVDGETFEVGVTTSFARFTYSQDSWLFGKLRVMVTNAKEPVTNFTCRMEEGQMLHTVDVSDKANNRYSKILDTGSSVTASIREIDSMTVALIPVNPNAVELQITATCIGSSPSNFLSLFWDFEGRVSSNASGNVLIEELL